MGGRRQRLVGEAVLVAGVLVVAFWVLTAASKQAAFHGDESTYIWLARYAHHLREPTHPEWGENYWTHTHPMLSYYVIGGWLELHGHDPAHLESLPRPYDWSSSPEENRRQRRVPDEALLAAARAPMVLLATGAMALLYLLGRVLGGVVAGLAAVALALGSAPAHRDLVRALHEAPLVFFLLLALLCGLVGARRGSEGGLPGRWALLLGLALGLGLATKLPAVLSLVATAGWGIVAATRGPTAPGGRGAWPVGRGWAVAVLVALCVFAASNPHLYPNPVLHTAHLFGQRAAEMWLVQRTSPHLAVQDPLSGVEYVLRESLVGSTLTGSHGLPIEAVLATVGGASLALETWRGWAQAGRVPPTGLVLLTVVTYVLGVGLNLGLALPRYVVPTVLIGALLSGVGVAALTRRLGALGVPPRRGARPAGSRV